jgi:hypothetical protein
MVIAVRKHKIAYMALPKAACSSVKAAIAQIDDEKRDDGGFTCDMKWHSMYPTRRFRPHRWNALGDDWYRFCVVRDPVQRLMSCYMNRVVVREDLVNCRNIRRGIVDLPSMPDPDFFFQNIKAYKQASSSIRHHTLPSWLFLGPDLTAYDDVFKIPELPKLAQKLQKRTGKIVRMERENATAVREKLTLDDLQPKTRRSLRKFVAKEYVFLAGHFANPLETGTWRKAA